jgi:hypothetical protein
MAAIHLADVAPLAAGGHRLVFQHPRRADALIKVLRPDPQRAANAGTRWRVAPCRLSRASLSIAKEVSEYLAASSLFRDQGLPAFLPRLFGFEETDLGLGLVVEKITGRNGTLAPSLCQLITEGGMTPGLRRQLDDLWRQLVESDLVFSDLNWNNIVVGQTSPAAEGRLVLVDGLGEKVLIPIHGFSRLLRRKACLRKIKRTERRIADCLAQSAMPAVPRCVAA